MDSLSNILFFFFWFHQNKLPLNSPLVTTPEQKQDHRVIPSASPSLHLFPPLFKGRERAARVLGTHTVGVPSADALWNENDMQRALREGLTAWEGADVLSPIYSAYMFSSSRRHILVSLQIRASEHFSEYNLNHEFIENIDILENILKLSHHFRENHL